MRGGAGRTIAGVLCAVALPGVASFADETLESVATRVGASEPPVLLGVTISGATLVSASDLSGAYTPYLARPYQMADLVSIADAITQRYRARGYFLSRAVVTQDDATGVAQITVIEGEISEVRLSGAGAPALQRALAPLAGTPATLSEMDRRLALAADIPGMRVRAHIEPDIDDPARHHLVALAERDRFEGLTYVDNRGSDGVGPWQIYSRLDANGALFARDQLGIGVFASLSDPREFAMAEARYQYVFGSGARAFALVNESAAHDGPNDATPDVGGEGQAVSAGYEIPLLRGRDRGLWLAASADLRSVTYDWLGGGRFVDEVRAVRIELRGTLSEEGHATNASVRASFGAGVLGASGASRSRRSRADADAEFASLNAHLSHYQSIGRYFGVFASVDGQYAAEPLLASEEFALGGLPYGRAFQYGALTGDRGIAALLEIRAGLDPPGETLTFLQTYAFADAGQVWNRGVGDAAHLSSVGFGFSATFADRITARWEWAKPLDTPLNDSGATEFFSLLTTY